MRSAIVHDWLVSSTGGAEKVLEEIHSLFPSPIYTLVSHRENLESSYFSDLEIHTSFIQNLFQAYKRYPSYLPLFPLAIERFDLSSFDLILSSSHCVAKGVLTHPEQYHLCYCHTPMRYAWDLMHSYLKQANLEKGMKGWFAQLVLHYLRSWDFQSAQRVDQFLANSQYVAARIEKFYGRKAKVIYPPVDLSFFQLEEKKEEYYLSASRLVGYKKIDLIVEAFSCMKDKKLVVIGDGPEEKAIRKKAGPNVELLGFQSDLMLRKYLQRAKGFVFAAIEDFGILPVEAMACGTPVIAYGKGGVTETVEEGKTGLFYREQTSFSLIDAIDRFEKMAFSPSMCRLQAEKFSKERFSSSFRSEVEKIISSLGAYSRKRPISSCRSDLCR